MVLFAWNCRSQSSMLNNCLELKIMLFSLNSFWPSVGLRVKEFPDFCAFSYFCPTLHPYIKNCSHLLIRRNSWQWRHHFSTVHFKMANDDTSIAHAPDTIRWLYFTSYYRNRRLFILFLFLFLSLWHFQLSFHKFSRQLFAFSLFSFGLISALLVLSMIYFFMKVSFKTGSCVCPQNKTGHPAGCVLSAHGI